MRGAEFLLVGAAAIGISAISSAMISSVHSNVPDVPDVLVSAPAFTGTAGPPFALYSHVPVVLPLAESLSPRYRDHLRNDVHVTVFVRPWNQPPNQPPRLETIAPRLPVLGTINPRDADGHVIVNASLDMAARIADAQSRGALFLQVLTPAGRRFPEREEAVWDQARYGRDGLSTGMQPLTLRVALEGLFAGMSRPGDRLDLYWTGRLPGEPEPGTRLLDRQVRILGLDRNAGRKDGTGAPRASVTIEVRRESVARLVQAERTGRLALVPAPRAGAGWNAGPGQDTTILLPLDAGAGSPGTFELCGSGSRSVDEHAEVPERPRSGGLPQIAPSSAPGPSRP